MIYKGATITQVEDGFYVMDFTRTYTRTVQSVGAAKSYINSGFDPTWSEVTLSPEAKKYLSTMMNSRRNIYDMPLEWATMFLENTIEAREDGHDWQEDIEVWEAFAQIHNIPTEMTLAEFKPVPNS